MFNFQTIFRIDWRIVPILLILMCISLLVISATDPAYILSPPGDDPIFFTPKTQSQLQRFVIGWVIFFLFAAFDYNKLRDWAWIFYFLMVLSLACLFLVEPIQNVHRWYRIPFVGGTLQPSEFAKLTVVLTLSRFLEMSKQSASRLSIGLLGSVIIGIPFLLILKQPDLGTSLVLCPMAYVMFYLGGVHRKLIRFYMILGLVTLFFMLGIFLGLISYDEMKPYATKVLKEYQYERLDPNNHHQKAAMTAIGVGGMKGSGWRASEFTGRGFLPYGYTDSVFPAFGEEFGLIGLLTLLLLFYSLIYFGFQATAVSKDSFGRLLASGVSVMIAMHIIVNVGMMCGLLPITGVPLLLVSYGGSSVFVTMAALGITQSIYSRRFMF